MIFDAIALIVLSGMMLVPLINIVVGLIVGAWLAGPAGHSLVLRLPSSSLPSRSGRATDLKGSNRTPLPLRKPSAHRAGGFSPAKHRCQVLIAGGRR